MTSPLVQFDFPADKPATAWVPQAGDVVENFGVLAKVVEVRPAPYNDVILKGYGLDYVSGQWAAFPAKCRFVGEPR